MFNSTYKLKFIVEGEALKNAIHLALDDSFKVLKSHIDAKQTITPSVISTKTFPSLIIFKYLHNHKSSTNIGFDTNWCELMFELCTCDELPQEKISQVVNCLSAPPENNKIVKTAQKQLKIGLRVFFYALWAQKAVLLPLNFSFPRTQKNKRWIETALPIYPETLKLIKNTFIEDERFKSLKGCVDTRSTYLKDYSYNILIATDWYSIEDIDLTDISSFRSFYFSHSERTGSNNRKTLPFYPLLAGFKAYSPTRCSYSLKELADACDSVVTDENGKERKMGKKPEVNDSVKAEENNSLPALNYNSSNKLYVIPTDREFQRLSISLIEDTFSVLLSRHYSSPKSYSSYEKINKVTPRLVFIYVFEKCLQIDSHQISQLYALSKLREISLSDIANVLKTNFDEIREKWTIDFSNELKISLKIMLQIAYCKQLVLLPRDFQAFFANNTDWMLEHYPTTILTLCPDGLIKANSKQKLLRPLMAVNRYRFSDITLKDVRKMENEELNWDDDFGTLPLTNFEEFSKQIEEPSTTCKTAPENRNLWREYMDRYLDQHNVTKRTKIKKKSALNKLISFIEKKLPNYLGLKSKKIPLKPADFTREHICNNDWETDLVRHLNKKVNADTFNVQLKHISDFFDWLELYKHDENIKNFRNPILDLDKKISKRPSGTNKEIFDKSQFPVTWSFTAAICDFYWYLVSNNLYQLGLATKNQVYDCEELGFIPVFYMDGKCYPIPFIPTRFTYEAVTTYNNSAYYYPTFQQVFENFIALETGIRHIHIRHLDANMWKTGLPNSDINIDKGTIIPTKKLNNNKAYELLVNTDKVKQTSWNAIVSSRVINTLLRFESFADFVDPKIEEIFYNDDEASPYPLISPLTQIFDEKDTLSGTLSEASIASQYRRLLFLFDIYREFYELPLPAVGNLGEDSIVSIKAYHQRQNELKNVITKPYSNRLLFKQCILEAYYCSTKYHTKHTPHGTRATVASEKITLLPPGAIKEYITGHESLACLYYYIKLDLNYLEELVKNDETGSPENFDSLLERYFQLSQKALEKNIRDVVESQPETAMRDLGAISFSSQTERQGMPNSGLIAIQNINNSQLAYFPTHICPFGAKCPKDVIEEFGEYNCGPCYYSVKTVDNIPSILGEIRKHVDSLEYLESTLKKIKSYPQNASGQLSKLEGERQRAASAITAWVASFQILASKVTEMKNKSSTEVSGKLLVENPKALILHFENNKLADTPLNKALVREMDSLANSEYATPSAKAQMDKFRRKLLINGDELGTLIKEQIELSSEDTDTKGLLASINITTPISLNKTLDDIEETFKKLSNLKVIS